MIQFKNVSYAFPKSGGVHDVNFGLDDGDFTFLIGPTGSGKTTIMRLIYMDLFPDNGTVVVDNYRSDQIKARKLYRVRRHIGMIFQEYHLLNDRTLFDNVALPLHIIGTHRNDIDDLVSGVLQDVGLTGKEDHYPMELSGGEQQRACIARALVKNPDLILADEPTGNLDPVTSFDLVKLLEEINEQGTQVFMASHDYSLIKGRGHRIVQMQNGRITYA